MATQVTAAAPSAEVNGATSPGKVNRGPGPVVPPWLFLHGNIVINSTTGSGDLKFHTAGHEHDTLIGRDQSKVIAGDIDYIDQGNLRYRFAEPIGTLHQVVVVTTNAPQDGKAPTLEIAINRHWAGRIPPRVYNTLPGEPIEPLDATVAKVDPAPGILVSTEPLADVLFTSGLDSSFSSLSLGDGDSSAGQQALLEGYKQVIDGLAYQSELTTINHDPLVLIYGKVGAVYINISFNNKTEQGTVTARFLSTSLGTAKFSRTQAAKLSVSTYRLSATVVVRIQNGGIWLFVYASARFFPVTKFGPQEIYHTPA